MQRNRLAAETSPYLQQHADNPVDWWPWGPGAFAAARDADKPVLLSVGYSACHWCHVMAHESFEDPATAALMNALFINVKVDREERPDIDKIYQLAQALMTHQTGGWPLTMFLTPDQQPFFGGTYFPREARHGMPAFGELLQRVAQYYHGHREEITRQGPQLAAAFARLMPRGGSVDRPLDDAPLEAVRADLERSFDRDHGGFGRAPKFPQVPALERCLRHWHASAHGGEPDLKALYMATLSLARMAEGGIRDQLGGGFYRYSVDREWMIPHFEKMLYDNGPLLGVYAAAHLATGDALFAAVAGDTADWLLREMRSPQGAFYSSLDADSEGGEGRYYVWDREEVRAVLDPGQYPPFARRFGLDMAANFEGAWHLHVRHPIETIAAETGRSTVQIEADLQSARASLVARRALRVRPARDEKVLTAWNALVIKGLATASRVLLRADLAAAATQAVDFIRAQLWRDGRLFASTKDGRAVLPAYLDDHAFLADALLELLQTRWRGGDFEFLLQLAEAMLDRFQDLERGGFFFTASDHEPLIHRSKTFADESLPAGNAVAASVLCRLGLLLADLRYVEAAERTLLAGLSPMREAPQGHVSLVSALEEFLVSPQIVVIRGAGPQLQDWSREIGRLYAPQRLVFAIPDDAPDLPAALAAKRVCGSTVAYVCTGMTCGPPLGDLGALVRRLRPASAPKGAPDPQV